MRKFSLVVIMLAMFLLGCNRTSQMQQTYNFDSISICHVNNGWVVNKGEGKLYKTNDGGKSWIDITPIGAGSISPFSYYFMDVNTAWVLYSNILYFTEDGGMHWNNSKVPFNSAILFFTRSHDSFTGWALKSYGMASGNEPVDLYKFESNSWILISKGEMPSEVSKDEGKIPYPGDKKGFVMLPDMMRGFITIEYRSPGDYGLYVTNDGGRTWHSEKLDTLKNKKDEAFVMYSPRVFNCGTKPTVILPVLCEKINTNHLDYSVIFFSKNLDIDIWYEVSTLSIKDRVLDIDIEDSLHWCVLTDSNLYKTDNGGKNWIELPPIEGAVEVQFVNSETGFALVKKDNKTMLYRTHNAAHSWAKLHPKLSLLFWFSSLFPKIL